MLTKGLSPSGKKVYVAQLYCDKCDETIIVFPESERGIHEIYICHATERPREKSNKHTMGYYER